MTLLDILRTCKIDNFEAPNGTPIRFNGQTIGRVIRNDSGYCEIAINDENAYSIIRKGKEYSFSLEVLHND